MRETPQNGGNFEEKNQNQSVVHIYLKEGNNLEVVAE